MVRRLKIDGDGQGDLAGHGGEQRAVLVYQIESYRHWQEFLGRDELGHGSFGENFTVEGLADDEVCIADRCHVLPGGDADGRTAAAVAAGRPPPPGVLPAQSSCAACTTRRGPRPVLGRRPAFPRRSQGAKPTNA
jgi:hypothetical protein